MNSLDFRRLLYALSLETMVEVVIAGDDDDDYEEDGDNR